MIRRWLRNWLGITELEAKVLPRNFVSREGRRIEPRIGIEQIPEDAVVTTTVSVSAPLEDAKPLVKGYDDAPVR